MLGGSPCSAPKAGRGCRQAFQSGAPPRARHAFNSCRASAVLDKSVKATGSASVVLPPSLRNNVAVLEAPNPTVAGGTTKVYLLAMSHVSQRSVEQVGELIRLVQPDVVAVELCKERVNLLVDPQDAATPPKIWHSRKITIEGQPEADESGAWPSQEELLSLLVCRPGRPVTQQDIEGDVLSLLSTGLFASVRPGASNAGRDEAPEFLVRPPAASQQQSEGARSLALTLALVPPLGCIRFKVQPRSLPSVTSMTARVDSSLRAVPVDQVGLSAICLQASDEGKTGAGGLLTLLKTRQRVVELMGGHKVALSFSGVDTGRVEMIVKAVKPTDPPYMSGLEGTAVNGEGFGIEPFRPQRGLFQVSKKMFLPQETLDRMRAERLGAAEAAAAKAQAVAEAAVAAESAAEGDSSSSSASSSAALGRPQPRVRAALRPWAPEELASARPEEPPRRQVQDTLAQLMSTAYARIQSRAGRTVGLEPGAAWREALEAATSVGCGAVVLADRPSNVTQHRMGAGLASDSGLRLGGALALTAGSLVVTLGTSLLPDQLEGGVLAAGLAAAAAVVAPVVGPFIEVSRFAAMSLEEIEDAVAVKEPIDQGDLSRPLRLFGEDALLDWPGAFPALIPERDAFMARAIAAMATGQPGVAPVYVLSQVDGKTVWRYAMPEGGPPRSAPQGLGDGALPGLAGVRAVVGVVGSAHVRGMVREWPQALRDGDVTPLLADVE